MTEYIIMASGEIITYERIEAWAEASHKDVHSVEAELLASGDIVKMEDYESEKWQRQRYQQEMRKQRS